jgi:nitroimidazol reductase NimA-like FMN-containing flavoprotein (pyridoxamine 5'-phosphate oxidase superfamily)
MMREIRRKDRVMEQEKMIKVLENQAYGILSTVDANGQPYGLPLSYVYKNGIIYFHSATEGHKLENLQENSKVSFCVVGQTCVIPDKFTTDYESVIAFGEAVETDDEEKKEVLMEILLKYSPDFLEKGKLYIQNAAHKTKVYKIKIDHMTGKARA